MRGLLIVALVGCRSSDSKPAEPAPEPRPAVKPPDEMDEKMRHCPLALDGAVSTLEDIDGGVRFTVKVPEVALAELRRRAHHVVDFAAKKTREGHGEFDGKGGGRMKNCPIVTDDVRISVAEVNGGARLDVMTDATRLAALRSETRERAKRFPFVGATISIPGGE